MILVDSKIHQNPFGSKKIIEKKRQSDASIPINEEKIKSGYHDLSEFWTIPVNLAIIRIYVIVLYSKP